MVTKRMRLSCKLVMCCADVLPICLRLKLWDLWDYTRKLFPYSIRAVLCSLWVA